MNYTDEDGPRCKVKIGAKWRDSQTMKDNATPRTMSRWVLDQGPHADRLQRALLAKWMRDAEDRLVWRLALPLGVVVAFAAWKGWL